jgi:hypothetical protein
MRSLLKQTALRPGEKLARIRHRFAGKIGQPFVRTTDFPVERKA